MSVFVAVLVNQDLLQVEAWPWSSQGDPYADLEPNEYVSRHLSDFYEKKVKPLEKKYLFNKFYTPSWTEAEFLSKPSILVLGQYSVGKTSFIEYLLGDRYLGDHVSPEPSTYRWVALMHGERDREIPGNMAAKQTNDRPFKTLKAYGKYFLDRFEVVESPAKILKDVILIDSPGVLAGKKHRREKRKYNFTSVVQHWAERSQRIVLLFDVDSLDLSDELREVILALAGNTDKILYVLNKADSVEPQNLIRVYGALLWSLGKVFDPPEVPRVYIGSFWDKPYNQSEHAELFDRDRDDLLRDLRQLPDQSIANKIDEFEKRFNRVLVHSALCDELNSQFKFWSGLSYKNQQESILRDEALEKTYNKLTVMYDEMARDDFPDKKQFRQMVDQLDIKFSNFGRLGTDELKNIDDLWDDKLLPILKKLRPDEKTRTDSADEGECASGLDDEQPVA